MLRQVPVASHMTVVDAWSQHSLYNENLKRASAFSTNQFYIQFFETNDNWAYMEQLKGK